MTNKEKKQYISAVIKSSAPFVRNSLVVNKPINCPNSLFKYRRFDKYSFEMLDKNYIYFCPALELDDPYECSGFVNRNKPKTKDYKKLMDHSMDKMLKAIPSISKETAEMIRNLFEKSFEKDHVNHEKLFMLTPNEVYKDYGALRALNTLSNLELKANEIVNEGSTEKFIKIAIEGPEKAGIFALSEEKNNRIMWSLYANKYKGYCIEYDFSKTEYIRILFPVLYKKNFVNNIESNIIDFYLEGVIESVNPLYQGDYSLPMMQYLQKDISWKSQKEWRAIWNPGAKEPAPPIKAIYLGFDVSKRNFLKMKSYSRKYGFDLYLMKIDANRNKLNFIKVQ